MWIQGWGELPGHLVVISGPSGSGKSTLVRRLLELAELNLCLSVSATTRAPRPGERDSIDYFFMDATEFSGLRDTEGGFLEFAEFNGKLYGTPARPVFEAMSAGKNVILEIEVQGALQVRERAPSALFLFVRPPTFADLERRLRARGTEDEAAIHRRLVRARAELAEAHWYDEQIVNDDLDRAVEDLASRLIRHGCGG